MTDERCLAEFHELDRATCLWLLPTEQVGRVVVDDVQPATTPVNYLVIDDAIVYRADAGSAPPPRPQGPA